MKLREGQGDPRCPATDGESWADYMPRLAEFLRPSREPLPFGPPTVEVRLPYREPGEDDGPWESR